jgi:hypothetical protein
MTPCAMRFALCAMLSLNKHNEQFYKFQSPWRLTSSAVFGTQFQTCKAGLTSNA